MASPRLGTSFGPARAARVRFGPRSRLALLALLLAPLSAFADMPPSDGSAGGIPPGGVAGVEVDAGAPLDPDAPRVGASLDRTEAHVGDRLTLTVSAIARAPMAASVRLPLKLDLGKFEVLDSSMTDRDLGAGNGARRFTLQIAAYETGELELPPIALEYTDGKGARRTVTTTPIAVQVKSLVGDDQGAAPQPLKGQRSVMVEDRRIFTALYWAGAGAAALIVLLIARAVVRRRRRRPRLAPVVPARPPDEVALERLAELRRRGEFGVDGYRPFHFELSEIVRAFLGARFGFDSLELTTTELVEELGRIHNALLDPQRGAILDLLAASDLVKFAKAGSDDAAARAALDAAEAIVQATRPQAAPPATEAAGG